MMKGQAKYARFHKNRDGEVEPADYRQSPDFLKFTEKVGAFIRKRKKTNWNGLVKQFSNDENRRIVHEWVFEAVKQLETDGLASVNWSAIPEVIKRGGKAIKAGVKRGYSRFNNSMPAKKSNKAELGLYE